MPTRSAPRSRCTCFKRATGLPPHAYVIQRRLLGVTPGVFMRESATRLSLALG
jgi:hypothetical protein